MVTQKSIDFMFYIRVIGVVGMFLLLLLSDYKVFNLSLILIAIIYVVIACVSKFRLSIYKLEIPHAYNLFLDVTMLSIAVGIRGGIRTDFYLGYYLILGYVVFVRSRRLLILLSLWMIGNYTLSVYYFTPVEDFSLGRVIIRMSLLAGTAFVLNRYDSLLSESEKNYDDAIRDAMHDQLTHVYNRRVMEYIDELLNFREKEYYVILLDIDHFKTINDTYGHMLGDMVLKELASVLHTSVQQKGICIRYGGEEFLVLLEKKATADIKQFLREIHRRFKNQYKQHIQHERDITFTAGISVKKSDAKLDHCIAYVDKALYYGKENGRNQYVIANDVRFD